MPSMRRTWCVGFRSVGLARVAVTGVSCQCRLSISPRLNELGGLAFIVLMKKTQNVTAKKSANLFQGGNSNAAIGFEE